MIEHSPNEPTPLPPGGSTPRVLLAEDNPITRRLVIDYFTQKGFAVTGVADGDATLAAVRADPPDVLLLDIQMPGLDGFAVLDAMRRDADVRLRTVPIIALTAMAMRGDEERCLAAGANAYCSKPVRLRDLVQMVQAQHDAAIAGRGDARDGAPA